MSHLSEDILDFWFGTLDAEGMADAAHTQSWFKKDPAFDKKIESRYGTYLEPAGMGAFDPWTLEPRSRLALVVLLDQFPRNLYRGSPRSFYYDRKAQNVAMTAIASGEHKSLPIAYAHFLLLPLMHAEDKELQAKGLELYKELAERTKSAGARELMEGVVDYARRHKEIIDRFGRFPHRNEVLRRDSTDEEIEFLKQPGSSF